MLIIKNLTKSLEYGTVIVLFSCSRNHCIRMLRDIRYSFFISKYINFASRISMFYNNKKWISQHYLKKRIQNRAAKYESHHNMRPLITILNFAVIWFELKEPLQKRVSARPTSPQKSDLSIHLTDGVTSERMTNKVLTHQSHGVRHHAQRCLAMVWRWQHHERQNSTLFMPSTHMGFYTWWHLFPHHTWDQSV